MPGEAKLKSWGNVRQHAPLGISCNQDKNRQIHKLTKADSPIRRSDPRQLDTAMTPTAISLHLRRSSGWPLDRADSHRHRSRIPLPGRDAFVALSGQSDQPICPFPPDINHQKVGGEEAGRLITAPLVVSPAFRHRQVHRPSWRGWRSRRRSDRRRSASCRLPDIGFGGRDR